MANAKRSKRQRGATKGLPGWAMLTIGLIIGLFVAFLVYLDDLEQTSDATARAPAGEQSKPADVTDEDAADEDGPRFEFYSILPELEVVVPDFGQGGTAEDDTTVPAPEEDAEPADSAPEEADRRYFLQAGSFRKAEQADRLKAEIALLGLDVAIQDVQLNGDRWHRVRVGPFSQREALQSAQQRLRANEIDYLVMREKASG
jgi:cell division protein FtsN